MADYYLNNKDPFIDQEDDTKGIVNTINRTTNSGGIFILIRFQNNPYDNSTIQFSDKYSKSPQTQKPYLRNVDF